MIEIKSRYTGGVIYTHQGDSLSNANLRHAYLSGADLSGADLRSANLVGGNAARSAPPLYK